jgi:hypothetical protein
VSFGEPLLSMASQGQSSDMSFGTGFVSSKLSGLVHGCALVILMRC